MMERTALSSDGSGVATGSSGSGAPGGGRGNGSGDSHRSTTSDCVAEILERLKRLLKEIHALWSANSTSVEKGNAIFFQLYFLVSELLQHGYIIKREGYKALKLIHPSNFEWNITLHEHYPDALYVDESLRLPDSASHETDSPRITKVSIDENRLVLQPFSESGGGIYGIRCRLCKPGNTHNGAISDIAYVGQTKRPISVRIGEHSDGVQKATRNSPVGDESKLLYDHVRVHIGHIKSGESQIFNRMFDVFVLPTGGQPTDGSEVLRRSWELFWQWIFRALDCQGGLGKR